MLALFFGTIHGMGFSNFLRATIMPGEEDTFLTQLFAFNIGVELGQLMIVAFILGGAFLALNVLKVKQREWNLFVSGASGRCGYYFNDGYLSFLNVTTRLRGAGKGQKVNAELKSIFCL